MGSDVSRQGTQQHAKPSLGELETGTVLRTFLKKGLLNVFTLLM
jgi:hypothetical protein